MDLCYSLFMMFCFSHLCKDLVLSVLGLVYKLPSENVTNLVYWQRNFVV